MAHEHRHFTLKLTTVLLFNTTITAFIVLSRIQWWHH